ncbi:coronatine-insensitive protein 1-like protein, partial [Tanacetum coccineum]
FATIVMGTLLVSADDLPGKILEPALVIALPLLLGAFISTVVWALAVFPTPTAYAPCAERLALTTVVRGAVTAHFAPRRGAVARNAAEPTGSDVFRVFFSSLMCLVLYYLLYEVGSLCTFGLAHAMYLILLFLEEVKPQRHILAATVVLTSGDHPYETLNKFVWLVTVWYIFALTGLLWVAFVLLTTSHQLTTLVMGWLSSFVLYKVKMDTVFDCIVHYIHDANDKNSFSLVSRTCYDVDAKTREHITVHLCYATPLRCRQRFPFIESLTLAGNPHIVDLVSSPCNWDHTLTPWVQEIATSFKRLKVVRFQSLVVHDSDLELLARSRGEKLRVLEIDSCSGFSTDGLLYIGKYCNNLRILSLENSSISEKDGEWLYELALHNSSIESLNFYRAGLTKFDVKDLALVAKNCSQKYFGGGRFVIMNPINHDCVTINFVNDPFDHAGIGMNQFGNNALGHTMEDETLVRKLLNAVPDRYLQIVASIEQYSDLDEMTLEEAIGALAELSDIGSFVLVELSFGCPKLCRTWYQVDCPFSKEALDSVFSVMYLLLRYYSQVQGLAGESDAGLVELSFGCPKLQNVVINDCRFSKEAFDVFRCNVPSLRYFQVLDQPNFKQIV